MQNCDNCGFYFNFKKGGEILDKFEKIEDIKVFIESTLQNNNKIIGNFKLDEMKKHTVFKNLSKEKRETVLLLYKLTNDNLNNRGLLSCSNCNFIKFIPQGTILLQDTYTKSKKKDAIYNSSLRINDNTLPRTKDFTCPNKSCKSHKDLLNKEAVFYREKNKMNLTWMCCTCKQYWS
tara:strand:+ start:137 stop:667 length:531 start_codon:yes stop_codon:yes gene_type:complete